MKSMFRKNQINIMPRQRLSSTSLPQKGIPDKPSISLGGIVLLLKCADKCLPTTKNPWTTLF